MALPPVSAEADHETSAAALPRVAETPVGGEGTVAGVTAVDADENEPVPTAFVARTVKV